MEDLVQWKGDPGLWELSYASQLKSEDVLQTLAAEGNLQAFWTGL